jgi:hypothetical protein
VFTLKNSVTLCQSLYPTVKEVIKACCWPKKDVGHCVSSIDTDTDSAMPSWIN